MTHYDLFVIGGGSGGVAAARASANYGAKVAIAEGDKFGGTCVNRGCMPKKWYMYGSHFTDLFRAAQSYGYRFDAPRIDWPTLQKNTFAQIARLNGIYDDMLGKAGVTIYPHYARFMDDNTIEVNGETITADKFIIAVGGKPFIPDMPGHEYAITSDDAFHLNELPERIMIIGGGYIGVEFACIFNGLGVDTTLMFRANEMLRGFDGDIRTHLRGELEKKGITLVPTTRPLTIDKADDGSLHVTCDHCKDWYADTVMFATGRVPHLEHLNLDVTGVELTERGKIKVDEWQQTSVPHIYAVGDITNTNLDLTPVAINEGRAFADTHYGNHPRSFSEFVTPTAIFSQPSCGTVGLTEEQARQQYAQIDIYRTTFRPTLYQLSNAMDERIMMKLIVDASSDKVVGAHMVGPDAAEIIQALGVALKAGATKHDFDRTCGVHPSLAEEFVTMREKVDTQQKAAA